MGMRKEKRIPDEADADLGEVRLQCAAGKRHGEFFRASTFLKGWESDGLNERKARFRCTIGFAEVQLTCACYRDTVAVVYQRTDIMRAK